MVGQSKSEQMLIAQPEVENLTQVGRGDCVPIKKHLVRAVFDLV